MPWRLTGENGRRKRVHQPQVKLNKDKKSYEGDDIEIS